jgi:hypothetical protein
MENREERFNLGLKVFKSNGTYLGMSENVSSSGMLLSLESAVIKEDISRFFPIIIHPPHEKRPAIKALAEIRWRRNGSPIGLGLKIHLENTRELQELIQTSLFS